MTATLMMDREATALGVGAGSNRLPTHQVDGRSDDLIIISRWARKELFAQVKFLYNADVDLRVGGTLFNMFLRDCKDKLVRLKINANETLSTEGYTLNHYGRRQPGRSKTWWQKDSMQDGAVYIQRHKIVSVVSPRDNSKKKTSCFYLLQ